MSATTGWVGTLLITLPLAAPVLAVIVARARREPTRAADWITVASAATILAVGVCAATLTVDGEALTAGSVLRIDALSALMLIVIGSVGVIATWASVSYVESERRSGEVASADIRRYTTLVPAFLAAMVLAVLSNNLGVLWAAVEATTIVTAFLVGHRRSRGAVEATWKYVVICSVGIALAYLGTILVHYAARQTSIPAHAALDWTQLAAHANELDQGVMRIAFALLVLGYGAKAGMVPLHSWLPDAHSQAPAPVSALMSGVLLPVAVYALIRYRVIAVGSLDPAFVRTVLLVVALASLALATSLIIAQRDYKRLLAYSSIEHMSLIVIGLAVGTPLALAAGLLHILGHGLGKAVLFCSAGQVLLAERTTEIRSVRGLLARRPVLAASFGVGFLALLGLPPFSLFVSELGLARAAAADGLAWVIAVALTLLVVVFVAITVHVTPMILGSADAPTRDASTVGSAAPLVAGLVALAVLGILAWPVDQLLRAASIIGGTP
ncbi:MAG TPA: proton-conducting transporter membrane subunit [Propionicimonas sp.]|nr:proton-conducting transporter membrane subunit [Propionicimonas sp.]